MTTQRQDRLQQLGHERLQRMALDRQPQPGHRREHGGVPRGGERDLARGDRPARGLDAGDAAVADVDAGDLAALDDVDAQPVGAAREGPRDVVVLRDAAARLVRRAEHGVADVAAGLDDRAELLDAVGVEPLRVDAAEAVRVTRRRLSRTSWRLCARFRTPRWLKQEVVVELLLQPLPELQRVLVDRRALVPEVVRADDRRVAAHVAAAEPARARAPRHR